MAQINLGPSMKPSDDPQPGIASIPLDRIDNLIAPIDRYHNELGTLKTLEVGILALVNSVWFREQKFVGDGKTTTSLFFTEDADTKIVSCIFNWFAISVCNYASLVGFIRALEKGGFSRKDLLDKKKGKKIADASKAYVKGIPELEKVLLWRNKVAAHYAITDPHDDNIATLDLSAMPQISLVGGKYYAGAMALFIKYSSGPYDSKLPTWSLTEVFQSLLTRYWVDVIPNNSSTLPPML